MNWPNNRSIGTIKAVKSLKHDNNIRDDKEYRLVSKWWWNEDKVSQNWKIEWLCPYIRMDIKGYYMVDLKNHKRSSGWKSK